MMNAPEVVPDLEYDLELLSRELDKLKTHVFLHTHAAFLGSLMSYLTFHWEPGIETAAVDGNNFYWNPAWFNWLKPEVRKTVLMHELWHCGFLHIPRTGNRDPRIWNYACDIAINNMLEREKYSFEGVEDCWKDQSFGEQPAEEIYDQLILHKLNPPCANPFGNTGKATYNPKGPPQASDGPQGDMKQPTGDDKQAAINNVVQAAHATNLMGGTLPGQITKVLKEFLAPIVPWEAALFRFFEDLLEGDFDWKVRDRRYPSIYLPGETEDRGKLIHFLYMLDVSGSVSDAQVVRFNSEVKFIKDTFKPEKLTLAQFSDVITSVKVFEEDDPFEELVVVGRGGTNWPPVKEYIDRTKPTAVIIFTDLYFSGRITNLENDIPVIWVAINNRTTPVPFGELIHIKA